MVFGLYDGFVPHTWQNRNAFGIVNTKHMQCNAFSLGVREGGAQCPTLFGLGIDIKPLWHETTITVSDSITLIHV